MLELLKKQLEHYLQFRPNDTNMHLQCKQTDQWCRNNNQTTISSIEITIRTLFVFIDRATRSLLVVTTEQLEHYSGEDKTTKTLLVVGTAQLGHWQCRQNQYSINGVYITRKLLVFQTELEQYQRCIQNDQNCIGSVDRITSNILVVKIERLQYWQCRQDSQKTISGVDRTTRPILLVQTERLEH